MFKGVDHSVSTNLPSTDGMPHLMVIHAMRVNLTDPDIHLLTTPRAQNYVENSSETGGLTVSQFLQTNHLQVAVNANLFDAREYYLPAGTPMDVYGLAISQGLLVSQQDSSENDAAMVFNANNKASIIYPNWPAASVAGVETAVSGSYAVLENGVDVARGYLGQRDIIHSAQPRTAYGLSADRRYLYLMTIDGRQRGYSEGAYDYETAEWLLLLGAADGINMDGGGSTTLVTEDTTGFPVRLNSSSAVADSGRERTIGSHFGVYAAPLPGFINDAAVVPDDTTARITWTTIEPASSQVQYGTAADAAEKSASDASLVLNHTVQLTGLTPNTGYYYRISSSAAGQDYVSALRYFVTTNYVTTNQLFDITYPWKFSSGLSGQDWTLPSYDDAAWSGPGPGLLWVDTRATGPNSSVNPRNTPMPSDESSGYPYWAYYLRTHFALSNLVAGSSLLVSGYIDDGGVFYLNGQEVYRLRMPTGIIDGQTLALGYPCDGDATCLDQFSLPAQALVAGDNVLAVEVHNYNARSADITFGIALSRVEPISRTAALQVNYSNQRITLSWPESGFVLQSASSTSGPWTDIAPAPQSPFVVSTSEAIQFFRLRR